MFTAGPAFFAAQALVIPPPVGGGGSAEDISGLNFVLRAEPFFVASANLSPGQEPAWNAQPFFVR